MELAAALRRQGEACASLGSPMYADLLARLADDLVADPAGPTAVVLAGHESASGPSGVALRLMGSVHRLVLERRAGVLATYYPSVGGRFEPDGCWRALRELLGEQPDAVREWLDRPPQTNETGRAAALVAGLLAATAEAQLPVHLAEIGSSAGLNLLADRFRFGDDTGTWHGPEDAAVRLPDAWRGRGPWRSATAWPEVVDRVGSDVMPVDPATGEGRLALTAYVWPDQVARHERLRGALDLAGRVPLVVRRQAAGAFVDALDLAPGRLTVLWHSVMWQYLDRPEQEQVTERIAALGEVATEQQPFAHLSLEPTRRTPSDAHEFWVVLEQWPGGRRRFLARSRGHGVPVEWVDD